MQSLFDNLRSRTDIKLNSLTKLIQTTLSHIILRQFIKIFNKNMLKLTHYLKNIYTRHGTRVKQRFIYYYMFMGLELVEAQTSPVVKEVLLCSF